MSQMIKYRNRDKEVSIKLGNSMTNKSHGLVNKLQYPIWRVNFCLVFRKIFYQPITPKIPDSYFDKTETHF
jgi:hypothetical protein